MKFGKDGDGNYGYYGADDSLIPFKRNPLLNYLNCYGRNLNLNKNGSFELFTASEDLILAYNWSYTYSGSYWVDYIYIYLYDSNGSIKETLYNNDSAKSDSTIRISLLAGEKIGGKYQLSNLQGTLAIGYICAYYLTN